jgi:hypothetical protein
MRNRRGLTINNTTSGRQHLPVPKSRDDGQPICDTPLYDIPNVQQDFELKTNTAYGRINIRH